MNQMLTGQVPRGWDAIDKAQLAGAVWGIFSTHIAPDLARKITSGMSGRAGAGGPSYELDLVLFTDFSVVSPSPGWLLRGLAMPSRFPGGFKLLRARSSSSAPPCPCPRT